jgi:hypothetical protein
MTYSDKKIKNEIWCLILPPDIQKSQAVNPVKLSGHYVYRQYNIQQFYVLPTPWIYVFCVDLRTNSSYFPIKH